MTVSVVVTRTEPGASETAARLCDAGYAPIIMPALAIQMSEATGFEPPDPDDVYIFTSANGVRAVLEAEWPVTRSAVCVGPATLEAARDAGFGELFHANGNADDVFDLICVRFSPDSAPGFVHVANADAAGDLVARLVQRGYNARFVPLYEAVPQAWSDVKHLWVAQSDGQLFFLIHSARAAEVVADWFHSAEIDPTCVWIAAISARALKPLQAFPTKGESIAARPNEAELMKALQTLVEQSVSSR